MSVGLDYLIDRGLTEETIKKFGLSYFDGGVHAVPDDKYNAKFFAHVKNILLSSLNENNTFRFNDCIIIPILNMQNKYITIQARRLNGEPKFDALPFKKKQLLYGLNETYGEIANRDHAYIVEGAFDFLVMWQSGLRNVVSSLGCALSYEQLCLITRFASEFTVIYDPDTAGKDGMSKARDLFNKYNFNCNTLFIPEGLDLDKFIIKHGIERVMRNAKTSFTI